MGLSTSWTYRLKLVSLQNAIGLSLDLYIIKFFLLFFIYIFCCCCRLVIVVVGKINVHVRVLLFLFCSYLVLFPKHIYYKQNNGFKKAKIFLAKKYNIKKSSKIFMFSTLNNTPYIMTMLAVLFLITSRTFSILYFCLFEK